MYKRQALYRAPELVRGFLEKILAPKQERTMNVPQRNRKRGQDMDCLLYTSRCV